MKRTSAADTGRFRPAAGGWRKPRKPPALLLRLADLLPTRLSACRRRRRRPPPTLSHSRHIDMRGVTSAGCVRGPTRADRSPLKKHK